MTLSANHPSHLARTFQALRHRNYRLFWIGQAFSLSGNWMQTVGESWLIYRVTGSPFALGAVSFIALLPVVPISFFGSTLIDRVPKHKIVVITQLALALTAFAWAILTLSGQIKVWQIVGLIFLEGAIGSIDLPARQAFLPELVGREDLSKGIALSQFLFSAARVVGPGIAGVVIERAGEGTCFLLNGLSFAPFIGCLLLVRNLYQVGEGKTGSRQGSVVHGLAYIRRTPALVWLLATMSVSSMLLLPFITLMPAIAKDVLLAGPEGLGVLTAAVGLGAMLGSLVLTNVDVDKQKRGLVMALYVLPVSVIAFTTARGLVVAAILALIAGANTTCMQTIFNSLVQLQVRDDMRGRVLGLYSALSVGMQRVGGMQAGLLGEAFGVPAALRVGAVASVAITCAALWKRPPLLSQASSRPAGSAGRIRESM